VGLTEAAIFPKDVFFTLLFWQGFFDREDAWGLSVGVACGFAFRPIAST